MFRSVGRGVGADTMIRSQALPSATSDVSDPADHTTREPRGDGDDEQRQRRQVVQPEEEQTEDARDQYSDREAVPDGHYRSCPPGCPNRRHKVRTGLGQVEKRLAKRSTEPPSGWPCGPTASS